MYKNKKILGIILTAIFAITMFTGFSQISFAAPTKEQTIKIMELQQKIDAAYKEYQGPNVTLDQAKTMGTNIEAMEKELKALKEAANENDKYDLKDLKYNVNEQLKLPGEDQQKTYFSDTKNPPIIAFILSVINYATGIIGTIAMIIFIVAGFMLIIAQGDQTKIDKAKEIIKYAVIGLIITFLSYVITIFVQSLFITQSVNTAANTASTTQPK